MFLFCNSTGVPVEKINLWFLILKLQESNNFIIIKKIKMTDFNKKQYIKKMDTGILIFLLDF